MQKLNTVSLSAETHLNRRPNEARRCVMALGVLAAIVLLLAFVWSLAYLQPPRTSASAQLPVSPLDEAERILTQRYVRGTITAQEYERMLVILRR